MPRSPQNIIRLRPPFGGLDVTAPRRSVAATDAVEALNVISKRGGIEVRPPLESFRDPAALLENQAPWIAYVARMKGQWIYVCVLGRGQPPDLPGTWFTTMYHWLHGKDGLLLGEVEPVGPPEPTGAEPNDLLRSVVVHNNIIYLFVRGTGAHRKVFKAGTWKVRNAGLRYPKTPPDVYVYDDPYGDPDAGPIPFGWYYYTYTFYDSISNTESRHAVATYVKPTSAFKASIVVFTGHDEDEYYLSSQEQYTHARIYRRQDNVDATYYRIGQIPLSPTDPDGMAGFMDEVAVPVKGFLTALHNTAHPPPDKVAAACWHKCRMWYLAADERLVYYSEVDQPEVVLGTSSMSVDADGPVQLISHDGNLFVFFEESVWVVSGDTPESFVSEPLFETDGAIFPRTVIRTRGALFFGAHDGIYRIDTSGLRIASEKIGEYPFSYDLTTAGRSHFPSAAVDERLGILVFNFPMPGVGTRQAVQWVYHLSAKGDQWTTWNIPALCVSQGKVPEDKHPRLYFVLEDSETGEPPAPEWPEHWPLGASEAPEPSEPPGPGFEEHDGTEESGGDQSEQQPEPESPEEDKSSEVPLREWLLAKDRPGGSGGVIHAEGEVRQVRLARLRMKSGGLEFDLYPVPFCWQTGDIDLGVTQIKKFHEAKWAWDATDNADQLEMFHRVGQKGEFRASGAPADSSPPIHRVRIAESGDTIALRIQGSASGPVKLTSLEIDPELEGLP